LLARRSSSSSAAPQIMPPCSHFLPPSTSQLPELVKFNDDAKQAQISLSLSLSLPQRWTIRFEARDFPAKRKPGHLAQSLVNIRLPLEHLSKFSMKSNSLMPFPAPVVTISHLPLPIFHSSNSGKVKTFSQVSTKSLKQQQSSMEAAKQEDASSCFYPLVY